MAFGFNISKASTTAQKLMNVAKTLPLQPLPSIMPTTVPNVRNSSAYYGGTGNVTTYAPPVGGGQASEFYRPQASTGPGSPATLAAQQAAAKLQAAAASPVTSGGGGGGGYSSGGGGGYSSGGGGYGGGGGAIGLPPASVSEPLTGFSSRYLPAAIPDVLQNPDVIASDVLETMGIDESGPLGALFGQNASYFVNQILPLLYAKDAIGSVPSGGGMVNRTAEYLKNAATPGGGVIDPMQVLRMVLAESQKTATTPGQTIGSSMFAGQTPAQQRSTMLSIVNDLANWAPNPRLAEALRNWAMSQGTEYVRQASQAASPYSSPFGTFLTSGTNAGAF